MDEVYEGEVVDMVPTEESGDNKTGTGNGLAFVIGAAATCAGMFLYKKVSTLVRKRKAKKEKEKEKQDSDTHDYLNFSSDDVNEEDYEKPIR